MQVNHTKSRFVKKIARRNNVKFRSQKALEYLHVFHYIYNTANTQHLTLNLKTQCC